MVDVRPVVLKAGGLTQPSATDVLVGPVGALFKQTTAATVTNTTADTSSIGAGVGSRTLPAGFWVAGRSIRVTGGGYYTTPLASAVTTRVKLGSTQLAMSNTSAFGNSQTNAPWTFQVDITCLSVTGSTAQFNTVGMLTFSIGSMTPAGSFVGHSTTPVAADVSTSALLDVTNAWDVATSTRSVTTTVCVIEVLP